MIKFDYSLAEIDAVANKLVALFKDDVILISGSMGAGKTTLIKSICKALGIVDEVSSPTYSLVNEYQDALGNSVFHFDLYRIEEESEALDFGIEEYFDSGSKCFIEWPDRVPNLFPQKFGVIKVNLSGSGRQLFYYPNCTFETMPKLTPP